MCAGKKILIGVCGGIAAYKMAYLVRILKKAGAEIKVVMTPQAKDFITPLTLSTLSKESVHSELCDPQTGQWVNHVELALWADVMIVAPATANTLSKMANAACDNLLLATYLSAKCPIFFAPAMDLDMWKHTANQNNIQKLQNFPQHFMIAPAHGELASGLTGEGRMAAPEKIYQTIESYFQNSRKAAELKILVTAGPTHEALDPVRFIGNHSSGKMGFEIAKTWAAYGAQVTLIAGPVHLPTPQNVQRIDVQSAEDMYHACMEHFPSSDVIVMCAAVADYTPVKVATQKIKKTAAQFEIELEKTKDILQSLGKIKTKKQTLLGFALETDNELAFAQEKLKRKNLDAIVLNSMNDPEAGFKRDTNKITIIDKKLETIFFPAKLKTEVAYDICEFILKLRK